MIAKTLIAFALLTTSLVALVPTGSAGCAVLGQYACTCGPVGGACGYDRCTAAVIVNNHWQSTPEPDGGVGLVCGSPTGSSPVVIYL